MYSIYIERYAIKQIKRLDRNIIPSIKQAIYDLGMNPRPFGYIKLKGENAYRIRVGDYRIIYEIFNDQLMINVIDVGHRNAIYG